MSLFVVRPSNSEKEKEVFRVRLTPASLLGLKLKPGDQCILKNEGEPHERLAIGHAIAWDAASGMKDNVVQTSKFLQDLYGLKLGDKVSIVRTEEAFEEATKISLAVEGDASDVNPRQRAFWEDYAQMTVPAVHDCLAVGQTLLFKIGTQIIRFKVSDTSANGLIKVGSRTQFEIKTTTTEATSIIIPTSRIGGLDDEMKKMQMIINRLLHPQSSIGPKPAQGILIYGSQGVGKTHFIDQVTESGWKSVVRWRPGTKFPPPKHPTLVIVRRRDLPGARDEARKVLDELEDLFSTIRGTPCLIIAEAIHPNDIHPDLRSRSMLRTTIELPIPNATQRQQILLAIWGTTTPPPLPAIEELASRTHGYVAADLCDVLRLALDLASETQPAQRNGINTPNSAAPPTQPNSTTSETQAITSSPTQTKPQHLPPMIDSSIITQALAQTRPSALHTISLTTPHTPFSTIGGYNSTKHLLRTAVSRPLLQSHLMHTLALPPKKGLLMYGPPGCSKTLLVRALATESGLNFLAVKGAELVSMYVGESERAVREIFRKARAASPSILFFDEIDSIASSRSSSSSGGGGGGGGTSSSSELNVLTTLLNEMDGFEPLNNVFVVAATNRPGALDPALLRPGRFDDVVYVPPPDLEARTEILRNEFGKSNYRAGMREAGMGVGVGEGEGKGKGTLEEEARYFAERTEGLSGAEVVGMRFRACEFALDDEEGKGRDWYGFGDVERALAGVTRSISSEMLEGFERWGRSRMMR